MISSYLNLMDTSGLVFDLTILAIFAAVCWVAMWFVKREHAIAFKNRKSQRQYQYETLDRVYEEERARNEGY